MANEQYKSIDKLPSLQSTDLEWIDWYDSLSDETPLVKDKANLTFLKMWNDRGSRSANTSRLREYMAEQNIEVEAGMYDSIMDSITDPFGMVTSVKSIINTTAMIWGVIFVLVMGVIILALYNIAKNPEPYAKIAADIFSPNPMK